MGVGGVVEVDADFEDGVSRYAEIAADGGHCGGLGWGRGGEEGREGSEMGGRRVGCCGWRMDGGVGWEGRNRRRRVSVKGRK